MRTATLALDIGGTKIAYGLIPDDNPHEILGEGRVPSKALESQTLPQIEAVLEQVLTQQQVKITRVGVGAPGVLRPDGTIIYAGQTMPGWAGTDLVRTIRRRTGLPVAANNDVRLWAYGEHHLGAGGKLGPRVLYLSLGTGVGGAVIDASQLLPSPLGTAGEIAHLLCADLDGRAVGCEESSSGTGLTTYYNARSTQEEIALPEIVARMRAGEKLASEVINGNLYGFGRAIGALVTLLDLDGVVLGGGVGSIGDLIRHPFAQGVADTALAPKKSTPVLCTTLGPSAPLIAAAAYAREHAH